MRDEKAKKAILGSIEAKNERSKDLERLGSPSVQNEKHWIVVHTECSFQSYKHPLRHPRSTKLKIVAVGKSKEPSD
eukprot:scaffold49510_cov37-Cyclotella_meneghiniana.AAC.2